MLDEQSSIGEACKIHEEAEVKESVLADEVIKANFDLLHADLTEEILDKLFEIKNNL